MRIVDKCDKLSFYFGRDKYPLFNLFKKDGVTTLKMGSKNLNIIESMNILFVKDYLFTADIDFDYSYEDGNKYYENYKDTSGACSSICTNRLYGRNYDWLYDNAAEFVMRTKAKNGRHASIAVGTSPTGLSYDTVKEGKFSPMYKLIPLRTLDGINDCGVACNTNVVPPHDKGTTTGTNPGKPRFCSTMLPRYILDNAESALLIIEKIDKELDIWAPIYAINEDIHVMLTDDNGVVYILEFVDNKLHVMSTDKDDLFDTLPEDGKAIMTNFHLSGFDGNIITGFNELEPIKPEDTTLSKYASGVERYKALRDFGEITTIELMQSAMKNIWYSKSYLADDDNFFYSELCGTSDLGDLSIYDTKSKFIPLVQLAKKEYEKRSRNNPTTWQSVHTSVYDLNERKLYLYTQEEDEAIEFQLKEE